MSFVYILVRFILRPTNNGSSKCLGVRFLETCAAISSYKTRQILRIVSSIKTLQSKALSSLVEETECSLPRLMGCSNRTEGVDLINMLTERDVMQLQGAIDYPQRLAEKYKTPAEFILSLDRWEDYDPESFLDALNKVNPALVPLAERVNFLIKPSRRSEEKDEVSRIMHRFVRVLRDEITYTEWALIFKTNGYGIDEEYDFQRISKSGYREGIIRKDLQTLFFNLGNVKRNRLAQILVVSFQKRFSFLSDQLFGDKFMEEISKK